MFLKPKDYLQAHSLKIFLSLSQKCCHKEKKLLKRDMLGKFLFTIYCKPTNFRVLLIFAFVKIREI